MDHKKTWTVNTSNAGKLAEYRKYLGQNLQVTDADLQEPQADPITIIRYKASQFRLPVLVDDVCLDFGEGDQGTLIKWQLHNLKAKIGSKAVFRCFVGLRRQAKVEIYIGETPGVISTPRGNSFGFNNYFQPLNSLHTFGEHIADIHNPRFLALKKVLQGQPDYNLDPLPIWSGDFQSES